MKVRVSSKKLPDGRNLYDVIVETAEHEIVFYARDWAEAEAIGDALTPCEAVGVYAPVGRLYAPVGRYRARWVRCRCGECENFWCQKHAMHVHDCPCPPIEDLDYDPYVSG